ncbi:hypothetical protein MMEU_2500 [Mycobacterium marinum str. Europe]|nr:hypothetical protein MMEU_2500 [Mycobacterium marinum str. Europe]
MRRRSPHEVGEIFIRVTLLTGNRTWVREPSNNADGVVITLARHRPIPPQSLGPLRLARKARQSMQPLPHTQ